MSQNTQWKNDQEHKHDIKFAHIMPASYLPILGLESRCELVLAHVAKDNREYRDWFANTPTKLNYRGELIQNKRIMDNGAFELGASMNPDELIELGRAVRATHLVLPDYPGEDAQKTIDAAIEWAPKFRAAGFNTVFVPQGKVGSLEDYDKALRWAGENARLASFERSDLVNAVQLSLNNNKYVDQIAISIIGVPNIYGAYKNKTQRLLSRWHYLSTLPKRNWYLYALIRNIPIHMLGLLDGINEIKLIKPLVDRSPFKRGYADVTYNIESWDSSAAVWYAHNDVPIDDGSPTGRLDGKFELEVDFKALLGSPNQIQAARTNMQIIDLLCGYR